MKQIYVSKKWQYRANIIVLSILIPCGMQLNAQAQSRQLDNDTNQMRGISMLINLDQKESDSLSYKIQ